MKTKRGKYLVNPVPFAMIVTNPKKRRAKKFRNPKKKAVVPAKKKRAIFVIKKARKKSRPIQSNPKKKTAVYEKIFGQKVRVGTKKHSILKAQKRHADDLQKFETLSPNPTKKTTMKKRTKSRKTRKTYARNPSRRRSRRRSTKSGMFRNPMGIVNDLFNPGTLTLAGGVVIGNISTALIINRLVAPPAGQMRPFDLPFVNYAVPAAEFYRRNWLPLMLYKVGIGYGASYLLRNQSPRLSQGLLIGTVAGAISDAVKNTGLLNSVTGGAGVGRYFPAARGTGAYVPGVNPVFTGPASAFLSSGSPMSRRGTGMTVNRAFAETAATGVPNPFGN